MYEKTSNKWDKPESEVKALVIFYNQYNYKLICEMMDNILSEFQQMLENNENIHDICRAQGALRFCKLFKRNVESVVNDAKKEEDGTFDEGEEINIDKEITENATGI